MTEMKTEPFLTPLFELLFSVLEVNYNYLMAAIQSWWELNPIVSKTTSNLWASSLCIVNLLYNGTSFITQLSGHLYNQETFWSPNSSKSVPLRCGHLFNQDTLTCPNGVHNREVPLQYCNIIHSFQTYSQNSPSSLIEVAVSTITSFADWVDIKYLTMDNGRILGLLFNIVSSPLSSHLQIQACDCLIDIVSKKGEIRANVEYRRLFLLLLSKDVLEWIHRTAL